MNRNSLASLQAYKLSVFTEVFRYARVVQAPQEQVSALALALADCMDKDDAWWLEQEKQSIRAWFDALLSMQGIQQPFKKPGCQGG